MQRISIVFNEMNILPDFFFSPIPANKSRAEKPIYIYIHDPPRGEGGGLNPEGMPDTSEGVVVGAARPQRGA